MWVLSTKNLEIDGVYYKRNHFAWFLFVIRNKTYNLYLEQFREMVEGKSIEIWQVNSELCTYIDHLFSADDLQYIKRGDYHLCGSG